MHKKEMRNWMFIISIFLLVACDEVAYLRNDEEPVLGAECGVGGGV